MNHERTHTNIYINTPWFLIHPRSWLLLQQTNKDKNTLEPEMRTENSYSAQIHSHQHWDDYKILQSWIGTKKQPSHAFDSESCEDLSRYSICLTQQTYVAQRYHERGWPSKLGIKIQTTITADHRFTRARRHILEHYWLSRTRKGGRGCINLRWHHISLRCHW